MDEAQGQTLISNEKCKDKAAELLALANPLSSDMDVLRPSLLPGLLDSLRHNASRKNNDVGACLKSAACSFAADAAAREERRVALAMTGARHPPFWSGDDRDAKLRPL